MTSRVPEEWLKWLYKVLQPEYENPSKTYNDVSMLLQRYYPSIKVRTKIHTGYTGIQELLLSIHGTIACKYSGNVYRVPIEIWIPKQYPNYSPIIYVTPGPSMIIHPGNYLDTDGRFSHPILNNWSVTDFNHNLLELFNLLTECFSKEFPIYSNPPQQTPQTPTRNVQPQVVSPKKPPKPQGYSNNFTSTFSSLSIHNSPVLNQNITTPPPLPQKPNFGYQAQPNCALQQQPLYQRQVRQLVENHSSTVMDFMDSDSNTQDDDLEQTKLGLSTALQNQIQMQFEPFIKSQNVKLSQINQSITQVESILQYEKSTVSNLLAGSAQNEQILNAKILESKQALKMASDYLEPELEQSVSTETVVHNQLYKLVSESKAIDDTIYALTELNDKGKISLDALMKHTRSLSRDQFKRKALINKTLVVLKL